VADKIYAAIRAFGDAYEAELQTVHRELDAYDNDLRRDVPRIVVAAYALLWCTTVAPVRAAIRTVRVLTAKRQRDARGRFTTRQ
jgi:hypothetical protein